MSRASITIQDIFGDEKVCVVLRPDRTFRDIINEREQKKAIFKKNVIEDFQLCLAKYGVCDTPFMAVIKEMYSIGFSPQVIMIYLEKCVRIGFNISPPQNKNSGDGVAPNGDKIEMKGSASFKKKRSFYLRHIRPHHDVTHYLFYLYDGYNDFMDWIYIPADDLYKLAEEYGYFNHSVHGTAEANDKNQNVEREISLHPDHAEGTKSRQFWDRLQKYFYTPEALLKMLDK